MFMGLKIEAIIAGIKILPDWNELAQLALSLLRAGGLKNEVNYRRWRVPTIWYIMEDSSIMEREVEGGTTDITSQGVIERKHPH